MTARRHNPSLHASAPRMRGAALLMAMLVLTLVASLAASMVWQQHRAIQVETAERARTQAAWVLSGALDWARLILREDARSGGPDHLGEPWAVPLAEARLSTFLALDKDHNTEGGPQAFLSGQIVDVQGRYNLRNLVQDGKVVPQELKSLRLICELLGVGANQADTIAKGLMAAWTGSAEGTGAVPLAPGSVAQLVWLGVPANVVARLATHIELLPVATSINLNTAPREVLASVVEGLDLGAADRLVQQRQRQPFRTLDEVRSQVSASVVLDPKRVDIASKYFEVTGQLRLDERVLTERSLVERRGLEVVAISRERVSSRTDIR